MESLDLASNDQSALGVCLNEANTPLEEGVQAASPSNVEEVGMGAPSRVVTAPAPLPKSIGTRLSKKWLPNQVMVSTYVPPLERAHPSTDMVAPDLEDVLKIVHNWSPSTKRNLRLCTCANFIRITSGYPWRPTQSSTPFYSLFI